MIGIDTGSLPDPYVQPALPGVVVTPRPGVATRVALPMTAAGEIEGVAMRSGGNRKEELAEGCRGLWRVWGGERTFFLKPLP